MDMHAQGMTPFVLPTLCCFLATQAVACFVIEAVLLENAGVSVCARGVLECLCILVFCHMGVSAFLLSHFTSPEHGDFSEVEECICGSANYPITFLSPSLTSSP